MDELLSDGFGLRALFFGRRNRAVVWGVAVVVAMALRLYQLLVCMLFTVELCGLMMCVQAALECGKHGVARCAIGGDVAGVVVSVVVVDDDVGVVCGGLADELLGCRFVVRC